MRDSQPIRALLIMIIFVVCPSFGSAQGSESSVYDFGKIELMAPMEHTFQFKNDSPEALQIKKAQLTPPLIVTRMTSRVEPGATGSVTVRLQQPREKGDFKGSIVLNFKDERATPVIFWAMGELVAAIEFDPFAAFYVSAQRGEEKTASIEISNHDVDPFEIVNVLHNSWSFTTEVETLEPGRRFRLTLRMKADAPAGQTEDEITLVTSNRDHPFLKVVAHTTINERVYALPREVDFETINVPNIKARLQDVASFSRSFTVYQSGGDDFKVFSVQTDVPFLRLTTHQGQLRDRAGVEIEVVPEKLKPGTIRGTIVIATNDPEFPNLLIPVKAIVEGTW